MPTPQGDITSTETWLAPAVEEVVEDSITLAEAIAIADEEEATEEYK